MAAKRVAKRVGLIAVVVFLAAIFLLYARPLPALQPKVTSLSPPVTQAVDLPWPAYGQAALGAVGFGELVSHGSQTATPVASIAKVITAVAVLQKKPLAIGEQGPTITLTADDVALYQNYLSQGGSVAKVSVGEQISEYQVLQGMLLPSANNLADSLALWAFGSMDAYLTYANQLAASLKMTVTHIADASGFSPDTKSSAQDLVLLAQAALDNPVLASIVSQSQADIPVAGTVHNVNWLLGTDGVVGIKTGDTDQAGGCYLFAAKRLVEGQSVTIVGAILGAPQRNTAMADSRPLINTASNGFAVIKVAQKNQSVAKYSLPWDGNIDAVAKDDLSLLVWRGTKIQITSDLDSIKGSAKKGAIAGAIRVTAGQTTKTVPAVLQQSATMPSWSWRLFHK